MHFRILLTVLLFLPSAGALAADQTIATTVPASPSLSESFAELTLGFCQAVVTRPGVSFETIAKEMPILHITGPKPLSDAGTWSAPLQDRLNSTAATPVYWAMTSASRPGTFHLAYALADGTNCIAVAQSIPGAANVTLARIKSDPKFRLSSGAPARKVYVRAADEKSAGYAIDLPGDAAQGSIVDVRLVRTTARP